MESEQELGSSEARRRFEEKGCAPVPPPGEETDIGQVEQGSVRLRQM